MLGMLSVRRTMLPELEATPWTAAVSSWRVGRRARRLLSLAPRAVVIGAFIEEKLRLRLFASVLLLLLLMTLNNFDHHHHYIFILIERERERELSYVLIMIYVIVIWGLFVCFVIDILMMIMISSNLMFGLWGFGWFRVSFHQVWIIKT